MVIETFTHGPGPVYERVAVSGRMLPNGLRYVDSWIADDGHFDTCYQLMEAEDPALLDTWIERWRDLIAFQVVPVTTSAEVARRISSGPTR
ncbi:DUF3303 family protein [Nonomuraea sp. NPDC005983]|uniref:DUF3303 domain-containing protein n=1 Tax=Nonomuraea sp. NPDC005983 TaxID=3155595 RepID=UPI0033AA65A8